MALSHHQATRFLGLRRVLKVFKNRAATKLGLREDGSETMSPFEHR